MKKEKRKMYTYYSLNTAPGVIIIFLVSVPLNKNKVATSVCVTRGRETVRKKNRADLIPRQ